jgi:imidazolonepropionase-like amidohydrolase
MQEMLGMSARDALRTTTVGSATLLGIARGTLASGDVADLVLLYDDIESDARPYRNPAAVLKAGALVAL